MDLRTALTIRNEAHNVQIRVTWGHASHLFICIIYDAKFNQGLKFYIALLISKLTLTLSITIFFSGPALL